MVEYLLPAMPDPFPAADIPARRWSHVAVECTRLCRYLSFDDCSSPDYDASAVKNDVFLSGSCKSAGFRGSAW